MKLIGPFFSHPLKRFVETIDPVAHALRTLPEAQLVAETEVLIEECMRADHHLCVDLMRWLYEEEQARRLPGKQQQSRTIGKST